MNIAIIGLGSMGRRRIRLLMQYVENNSCSNWKLVGIDMNEERCTACSQIYNMETFSSIAEACNHIQLQCAIVSTSPLTHEKIIWDCLNNNLHVFTELNLVSNGYDQCIQKAKELGKVLFLSSTFLYRKEVQYIKNEIRKKGFRGTYRYHIGQYLPSWHPWEDYQNFFVANKATNACREIFAIELPWLADCFGDINRIYSKHKKCSSLDVDYDDTYQVIIEHDTGITGTLCVDVVTPVTERNFEMFQENFYVAWHGTPDTLVRYDKDENKLKNIKLYDSVDQQEGYNQFVIENAYYDEIKDYINVIQNGSVAKYSFEKDKGILKIIDEIEK